MEPVNEQDQREELEYLATTLHAIDTILHRPPPDGTELLTEQLEGEAALQRLYSEQWADLQAAAHEPYFGRFDFSQVAAPQIQQIYLGKSGIRAPESGNILVHDWRAPISSLFYQSGFRRVVYTAPAGTKMGDVSLRRRYFFADGQLLRFVDERPFVAQTQVSGAADYLRDQLSQPRAVGLRDIIATIQAEQDELIRAPLETLLIVQGVAGSGKTSIALHRLSYLLYTYSRQLAKENVLVIGPNPVFLASIAPLFPQLGLDRVVQYTFWEWAIDFVAEKGLVAQMSADEPLERFVDRSQDRQAAFVEYQRLRLLASLRMVDLMRAFFALLQAQRDANATKIALTYQLPRDISGKGTLLLYSSPDKIVALEMPQEQVRALLRRVRQRKPMLGLVPQEQQRELFERECLEWLWRSFANMPTFGTDLFEKTVRTRRTAFEKSLKTKLKHQIQSWWPALTPSRCLSQLLGDPALLERVAATLAPPQEPFTVAELELLFRPQRKRSTWTAMDLPLLCLARLFLTGRPEQRVGYVVIDEAQDRSALELLLLRQDAIGMTMVGDIAQGVFAYRGVASWEEAMAALGAEVALHTVQRSYRSTWEISQLANRILQRGQFAQPMALAEPFERHGSAPQMQECASVPQMAAAAVDIARAALASGKQSVALIAKTIADCREIASMLDDATKAEIMLLDSPDQAISRKVVLLPVWLAKGLEFDAVVILGADTSAYTTHGIDAKLLYVAVTRALHELTILHVGQLSELLVD